MSRKSVLCQVLLYKSRCCCTNPNPELTHNRLQPMQPNLCHGMCSATSETNYRIWLCLALSLMHVLMCPGHWIGFGSEVCLLQECQYWRDYGIRLQRRMWRQAHVEILLPQWSRLLVSWPCMSASCMECTSLCHCQWAQQLVCGPLPHSVPV